LRSAASDASGSPSTTRTSAESPASSRPVTSAGLGLADVTGRLEAGLSADVLVVEGDPLASLAALRNPLLVLAQGREA